MSQDNPSAHLGVDLSEQPTVLPPRHGQAFLRNPLGFLPLVAHVPLLDDEVAILEEVGHWSSTVSLTLEENEDLITFPALYPVTTFPKEIYGDQEGVSVVVLTDRRGYWSAKGQVTRRFNMQLAGGPAGHYEVGSDNAGAPWSWQEVVDEIRSEVPGFPAVDITALAPTGHPENLVFDGVPIGEALDRLLAMMGGSARVDVTVDPPTVTVVRQDDPNDPLAVEALEDRRIQGGHGRAGDLLHWPATIKVRFEVDDPGRLAGAVMPEARWWTETVAVDEPYVETLGTVVLYGHLRASWPAAEAAPLNETDLADEAARLADAYLARLDGGTSNRTFDGFCSVTPHPKAEVIQYSWSREFGAITTVLACDQYPRNYVGETIAPHSDLVRLDGHLVEPGLSNSRLREGPGVHVTPQTDGGQRISARLQHAVGRVLSFDDTTGLATVRLQRWSGTAWQDAGTVNTDLEVLPLPLLAGEMPGEAVVQVDDIVEIFWHGDFYTCQRSALKSANEFWALITGYTLVSENVWEYDFTEVVPTGPAPSDWGVPDDAVASGQYGVPKAHNTIEANNSATGRQGNGINVNGDLFESVNFTLRPAEPEVTIVRMYRVIFQDTYGNVDVRYLFQYENAVDGTCEEPES